MELHMTFVQNSFYYLYARSGVHTLLINGFSDSDVDKYLTIDDTKSKRSFMHSFLSGFYFCKRKCIRKKINYMLINEKLNLCGFMDDKREYYLHNKNNGLVVAYKDLKDFLRLL